MAESGLQLSEINSRPIPIDPKLVEPNAPPCLRCGVSGITQHCLCSACYGLFELDVKTYYYLAQLYRLGASWKTGVIAEWADDCKKVGVQLSPGLAPHAKCMHCSKDYELYTDLHRLCMPCYKLWYKMAHLHDDFKVGFLPGGSFMEATSKWAAASNKLKLSTATNSSSAFSNSNISSSSSISTSSSEGNSSSAFSNSSSSTSSSPAAVIPKFAQVSTRGNMDPSD
jgi:hypothetical protein